MKTEIWAIGKKCGIALLALPLLAGLGCAHRELTAPCSDYKAASFTPAAGPSIPCDTPLQMQRPPWIAGLEAASPVEAGG